MRPTLRWPAWLARRDERTAPRLPGRRIEGGAFRFFLGVLLAVPVGVVLWLLILHAARTALGSG
jgi:hypothetical protein